MRLIALVIGACGACLLGMAGVAGAESLRVALLPIVVHSSGGDTAYLSQGLADMLSARLEQGGGIDVVRIQSNDRSTTSNAVAVEAARSAGTDYVVYGSFTQFGQGASLDLQCAPVTDGDAHPRRLFIQSGTLGEIIPKLDTLAEKISRYLRSGDETGASPEAPVASANGYDELRRRVEALERAVYVGEGAVGGGAAADAAAGGTQAPQPPGGASPLR